MLVCCWQSVSSKIVDCSFSALRVMDGASGVTGGLLYAEFVDVSNPASWFFYPSTINFYELYNMTADPFALENMYASI